MIAFTYFQAGRPDNTERTTELINYTNKLLDKHFLKNVGSYTKEQKKIQTSRIFCFTPLGVFKRCIFSSMYMC